MDGDERGAVAEKEDEGQIDGEAASERYPSCCSSQEGSVGSVPISAI